MCEKVLLILSENIFISPLEYNCHKVPTASSIFREFLRPNSKFTIDICIFLVLRLMLLLLRAQIIPGEKCSRT